MTDDIRTLARIPLLLGVALLAALFSVAPVAAQEESDSARIAELERRIEAITRELERARLGGEVVEADTSLYGFGPAASKVYRVERGVSIGGYGEVLYENFAHEREDGEFSGKADQFDALRGIVYVGYKFSDDFIFNSEIEWEHSSPGQAGSVSLEFAYIDWLVGDNVGIRGGLLLAPMGFLNELHEPPVFLGTERPVTESVIIPSTWRENGLGVFGGSDDFAYRVYLMNSFDGVGGGSSNASGFSDAGLRGGRQKGSKAVSEDFALVGRVDYVGTLGLTLGASFFAGETAQNRSLDGEEVGGGTFIWEGHVDYQARGWELRGLVAGASVDDAAEMSELKGFTGSSVIGEELFGWYAQAGYDLLRTAETAHKLVPYVRFEQVNTQEEVPVGFLADPSNDQTIVTFGAEWQPLPNIVAKLDYQSRSNEAETGVDQFNVALGYLF